MSEPNGTSARAAGPLATRTSGTVRVVGSGLLGASIGHALTARGVDVVLVDASPAQLRLAIGCVAAFLVGAGALAVVIAILPELGDPVVLGVPLSWLAQAYAFYPVILVFALIFVRAAARNERRYRHLAEPGSDA